MENGEFGKGKKMVEEAIRGLLIDFEKRAGVKVNHIRISHDDIDHGCKIDVTMVVA